MVRKISSAYAGGAVGALVDSLNIWLLGKLGVTTFLGISLMPKFSMVWLYPRLVWGGIWGLLFMLPLLERQIVVRGVLFSLGPTLMVFFKVFPEMGRGLFGLGFGTLTPGLVLVLNFVWGIVAALWYRQSA